MVFAPCVAILGALLALSSLPKPALSCVPQLHIHDETPENPVAIGTDGPADPATVGFNLNHLGIQVSDIAASREFYGDVLGLRHIFTFTASEDYIIVYMGYAQGGRNGTGHQTGAEMARDQRNSNGLLELIWAKDNTNIKSRVFGFSHLGFIVPIFRLSKTDSSRSMSRLQRKWASCPRRSLRSILDFMGRSRHCQSL